MAKYLDEEGLRHLWAKIDGRFDNVEAAVSGIGYTLSYDETGKTIKLMNGEDTVGSIDAAPFIKDGMLDDVEIVEATTENPINGEEEGKFIKFTWNTDGDKKVDYIKVTDIAVEPETDNTKLSAPITVTGVTVGNLTNGTTIEAGKSLQDILTMILMKELNVTASNPTVSISNSGTAADTYEVGTSVSVDLSHTYSDGKFKGETGYDYEVAAGCAEGTTTYYKGTSALTGNTDTISLTEGSTSYNCKTTYDASTATPVTNFGNNSSVTIAAGTATSSNITFTGKYKYFVGCSTNVTYDVFDDSAIRALNLKSDWITKDGTTTILNDKTVLKSNGTSIVIACPSKYKLATITNGVGADILPNFTTKGSEGTVAISNGVYNVYVYPITNGAKVEFKNATLTKA